MGTDARRKLVPALKVHQWLDEWDEIDWRVEENRSKPQKCFFQFNMPAPQLRALCGIYPRSAEARESASEDTGIQRRHEPGRSKEISRFVRFGYPWSNLTDAKRESGDFRELRQPGWLPTAIVVNILTASDERLGKRVAAQDLELLSNLVYGMD